MKRHAGLILMFFMITAPAAADHIELVESIPVETSLDNADIRNTAEVWVEMISDAEHSLDFGQFYLSHKEGEALTPILDAVYLAADRGVKVRFIIDGNMYNTYPGTADALNEYENISVRTYDLENLNGGVLHAKYFIVDRETLFLGSQNFDWRALRHIHELGIRILDRGLADFYREIFELDWRLAAPEADVRKIAAAVAHERDLKTLNFVQRNTERSRQCPPRATRRSFFIFPTGTRRSFWT
ncbi:MAG: phospholipase D-like domain-containing protein [Candidatus Marinimicrobia bacterium]|nr:phospholipase D-like domain-containing protein [Candidatus Neomarinimicrobiota bacterium]